MLESTLVVPGTAARLTPVGRGAVAVVRVRGIDPSGGDWTQGLFQPHSGIPLTHAVIGGLRYGRWGRTAPEDIVLCRTRDDEWEVQCHGGEAAVARILADLAGIGLVTVTAAEQCRQTADLLQAELETALTEALTWRTADLLNEQCQGTLRQGYEELRAREWTPDVRQRLRRQIQQMLGWSKFGVHLVRPWSVVLTGRPNVGKSSLINVLLGFQRSIVSDLAGTTRDVVTSMTAFDGWPVQLADTAGLRDVTEELEASGIARARARLDAADLPIVVLDLSTAPTPEDFALLSEWPEALVVAHKIDLPDQWGDRRPVGALAVSSVTQAGLVELQRAIVERLVLNVPAPGTPVPTHERQVVLLKSLLVALDHDDFAGYQQVWRELFSGPA